MAMHSQFAIIRNEPTKETQRALEGCHSIVHLFLVLLKHNFLSSLCRSQDSVREGQLYLVLKTKLIVMSSWDTSPCTVCASPWPASSFYSPLLWLVFVPAKTHVQLYRMGKYYSYFPLLCTCKQVYWTSECFVCFRFWFFKFLILIGITVGAFFIPDGTFHTGTHVTFLFHFSQTLN